MTCAFFSSTDQVMVRTPAPKPVDASYSPSFEEEIHPLGKDLNRRITIGAAVPEIKLGDVQSNASAIRDQMTEAEKLGCDLLLFSDLALTGSTCGMLFLQKTLLESCRHHLVRLAHSTNKSSMLTVLTLPLVIGSHLVKTAVWLYGGRIWRVIPLLPSGHAERSVFTDPSRVHPDSVQALIAELNVSYSSMLSFRKSFEMEIPLSLDDSEQERREREREYYSSDFKKDLNTPYYGDVLQRGLSLDDIDTDLERCLRKPMEDDTRSAKSFVKGEEELDIRGIPFSISEKSAPLLIDYPLPIPAKNLILAHLGRTLPLFLLPDTQPEWTGAASAGRQALAQFANDKEALVIYAGAGLGESVGEGVFAGRRLILAGQRILAESDPFTTGITYATFDVDDVLSTEASTVLSSDMGDDLFSSFGTIRSSDMDDDLSSGFGTIRSSDMDDDLSSGFGTIRSSDMDDDLSSGFGTIRSSGTNDDLSTGVDALFSSDKIDILSTVDDNDLDDNLENSFFAQDNLAAYRASTIFQSNYSLKVSKNALQRSRFPLIEAPGVSRRTLFTETLTIQAHALATRLKTVGVRPVLGLSGGLDSAIAFLVCLKAADFLRREPSFVLACSMPGPGTSQTSIKLARTLGESAGVDFREIPIHQETTSHLEAIGHDGVTHDLTYENAQARERTQILMDLSNMEKGLVVGTGDLSEMALGWCTYNGDQMSMYAVNASLSKTVIRLMTEEAADMLDDGSLFPKMAQEKARAMAAALREILARPVSPELLPPHADDTLRQITEDSVGPYELVDFYLWHFVFLNEKPSEILVLAEHVFRDSYTQEELKHWLSSFIRRFFNSQFKRKASPDGVACFPWQIAPISTWYMPSDASSRLWLDDLLE